MTVGNAWRCYLAVFHQFVCAAIHVFLVAYLPFHLSLSQIRVHGLLHQIHDEEPAERVRENQFIEPKKLKKTKL